MANGVDKKTAGGFPPAVRVSGLPRRADRKRRGRANADRNASMERRADQNRRSART
ncbi:hypothetical protein LG3211_0514 [Lysobacter gummosus]|nr:hypothetical protein LG3211_0514 [Lysobacter gummosus]